MAERTFAIRNEAISASAGTGKTFQLAARYVQLLGAGVKPQTIVALTFSRKAAGEIFDRIVEFMTDWIEDADKQRAQSKALGMAPIPKDRLIALLRDFVGCLHLLPIGTIDSFFVRIVRTFPFEFGLTGEFEIIDDFAFQAAKQRVFRHILWERSSRAQKEGFLEEFKRATFGEEQKTLYKHLDRFVDEGHSLYLATLRCSPWGKAAAIWPQGNELLDTRIDARREAECMRAALDRHADFAKREKWDAFLEEVKDFSPRSSFGEAAGYLFDRNLMPSLAALKRGESDIGGYKRAKTERLQFSVDECTHLARLVEHVIGSQIQSALTRSRGMYEILRHYEQSYERMFRRSGKLTFSDILHVLSPAGFRDSAPMLSHSVSQENKLYIDYRLDSRYDHWLLDEFQDTSRAQWMVLRNLIDEVMQSGPGARSFFYVGDIKQAIYGWRGGDAALFALVHRDLETRFGSFALRPLSDSWRSGPDVIETVNRVFGGLKAGRVGGLAPDFVNTWDWPEHATNKGDMTGHAAIFEIAKHRGDMKEDLLSKKVAVMAQLIGRIQPSRRSLSIAVLTRRNDVAEGIASQLEQHGIRTALEGAIQICDNDLVQVMLSLVKFAEHPGDTFAREHIRMTPLGTLLPPKERAALEILGDIYHHGFAYLVRTWAHLLETQAGQTLNDFCRRRLGELLTASKLFDATGNKSCLDYIDFIRSFTIPASSHSGAVQVLTTHKAKGLEYDVVFLADLDGSQGITRARGGGVKVKKGPDGEPRWALVMPSRGVAEQDATLAGFLDELDKESFLEELCVLYVGMTRAAKALYMLVEQKGPSSKAVRPADIVRDTLPAGEVPHGDEKALAALDAVCLYAKGPENWYEKYPAAKEVTLAHGTERKLRVSFDEALEATAPSRMEKRTISLSALLEGRTQEALVLGLAVHSIFERLKDPGSQDVEAIAKEWRECTEFGDKVKAQASEMFLNACASAEVRSALTLPGEHATVWIEKAFDAVVDNQWVSGVFDRVTLVAGEAGGFEQATIVDYKTDYVGSEKDIEGIVATYRPQLLLYRTVLGRLVDLAEEHIEMKLVLAAPARVVVLDP